MMGGGKLRSFEDLVREIAEKYNVSFELVESILIDFVRVLYYDMQKVKDDKFKKLLTD
jgi:hypothetical protein